MKASLAFAAIVVFGAGIAGAQTPPTRNEAPPPPSAKPGATVSGVTVMANPMPKSCGSRDTHCIDLVVAKLKQQYAEELNTFCFLRETRAVRTQFASDQLLEDLGAIGPPIPTALGVNSALKAACSTGKK